MANFKPAKVALIGSGAISGTYLDNMGKRFSALELVGCSDIIPERSAKRAAEFGIRQMTNEEIWADPEIEIVVNTTYPTSHYEVSKKSLLAGKHVQSEKMMAVTLEEGEELQRIADEKGLKLGLAPDTFLGGGLQSARKLIDTGMIGEPIYAVAMVTRGYHATGGQNANSLPFVFLPGGGIPFDMAGYYLQALVHLLGPVARVSGFCKARTPKKPFENPHNPLYGQYVDVNSPNMIVGALDFVSGCYGTITAVSETFGETPRLEIYGTNGTLICNDPNTFGGPIYVIPKSCNQRLEMPITHGFTTSNRGVGAADIAWAVRTGRPHRCCMGLHVFEIVHGIWQSDLTGQAHVIKNQCAQPAPLPAGFTEEHLWEAALA